MSHLVALAAALGPDATLISDSDITASYSRDHAPFAVSAPPFAVLLASRFAPRLGTTDFSSVTGVDDASQRQTASTVSVSTPIFIS